MSQIQRTPKFVKWLLQLQVFLLRRQWMGPLNGSLMIITTTGRKTGKQFSTPIGFAYDGDDILAFNLSGQPNWYRNLLANPKVSLEIRKQKLDVIGEAVSDDAEIAHIFDVYRTQRPENFARFFKVPLDMPGAEAARVVDQRIKFVRFRRI